MGTHVNILHTEFLVHWTGKDFHDPPINDLNDAVRRHYVDRLADVLEHGVYMKPGTEKIHGSNAKWISATIPRTCFTEIKLTQARAHALRYGLLGIGVHRSFVLQRQGNPVFYVQSGDDSAVVENLDKVHAALASSPADVRNLEAILGYVKKMSEQNSADLHYYDELEWRIVHLDRLEEKYLTVVDRGNGIFRINLAPEDVKLVVFPDDATRQIALSDSRLGALVKTGPIFVTLHACGQF